VAAGPDFKLDVLSGAAAAESRPAILERLREFNTSKAGPANWEPLCVAILDEEGALEGGLYGNTLYDWLVIELLFVPERLRGSGVGAQLVAEAEQHARARGCIGAWLDTFSFQAPGFYEKLGYCLAGTIPDHPVGGASYLMIKRWDGAPTR
jgi:GNAT superfamily N-acetyltransferase